VRGLARVEGIPGQARRELRAPLLQRLRARAQAAGGSGQLVHVARAGHTQPIAVRRSRKRRDVRGIQGGAQVGALLAGQRERTLGGLRDLRRIGNERSLLGGLAERREHGGLLHAPGLGEREPVRVDGDPAELRHIVVVEVVVLCGRPESAQVHEPAVERIGDQHADDLLAGSGERLRGRGGREQLVLARHGG